MPHIFVTTKPIQILNSYQIAIQHDIPTPSLYIAKHFKCDDETESRLQSELGLFDRIRFFDTTQEAIEAACDSNPDTLFLDSDIGFKVSNRLKKAKKNKKTKINIFEEGILTYVPVPFELGLLKSIGLRLLGYSRRIGESSLIDSVFVTEPAIYSGLYPNKRIYKFRSTFAPGEETEVDWIQLFGGLGFEVIPAEKRSQTASLILSSHEIESVQSSLKHMVGDTYLKIHPHIYDRRKYVSDKQYGVSIESIVPAEFCIMHLNRYYKKVRVIHSGSTAQFYLGYLPNVEWVDARGTAEASESFETA